VNNLKCGAERSVSMQWWGFEVVYLSVLVSGNAGFEYSPAYTADEALQIRAGVHSAVMFNRSQSITLKRENRQWVLTPRFFEATSMTFDLEVEVEPLYKVVVDIIDYNPETNVERVTVYDSRVSAIRDNTQRWVVDEDLVDFPVVSQLTFMTIRWQVSGIATGRLAFVLRSSKPLLF
jgi:hypothetical protein